MAEQTKSSLGLLSKFGINMNSEIEGLVVTKVKEIPNRKNVFGIVASKEDGSGEKKFLVGKKSLEEGLLVENDKGVVIAAGFETYVNNENLTWVRSKNAVTGGLKMDF